MAKIGDVCKVNMGQSPDSSTYNLHGEGIPFYQGNADFGEIYPVVKVWCSAPVKIAEKDDILISVRAPIGALNIAKEKCCIGRGLAALSVDESICKQKYLWYAIESIIPELISKGTGSTFKAISKNVLLETNIGVPTLNLQNKVVSILDNITSIIKKRKQQLLKLNELVTSRFIEMFEDKYLKIAIGDTFQTTSGGTPSKLHPEYYENGDVPWLTSGEVNLGVIFSVKSYITKLGVENSSAKFVPKNSVVIAMYGATTGQVGLLKLKTTTNQAVCSILPNKNYIPEYLYYAVKQNKEWMISQAAGGAQPNISQGVIKKMNIIDAPYIVLINS